MLAGELDGLFNLVVNAERVGDFLCFGSFGDFDGFGAVFVIDEIVFGGLVFGDVGFGV